MIRPRPIPGVDSNILEHAFSTSVIQPPKEGTLVMGGNVNTYAISSLTLVLEMFS